MWRWAVACAALGLMAQTREEPKAALERRGLYHATVIGRFVDPKGDPVPGVAVQLNAGKRLALPWAKAVTGVDGRFVFRDVNGFTMPRLRWHAPEQWLSGEAALVGETGEQVDAGTIELQPDAILRVGVEVEGGVVLDANDKRLNVSIQGRGQFGWRINGEAIGAYQVIRQIPFEEGQWAITFVSNGRRETYRAPFQVQRGRRDQVFLMKLLRNTLQASGSGESEGEMEVREGQLPPIAIHREFRVSGRLLAPDGSPVEGAVVGVGDFPFRQVTPEWTATGADGAFHFTYTAPACSFPAIFHGDYVGYVRKEKLECDVQWGMPRDLVMSEAARLAIELAGVARVGARAYWWHDSFGWRSFSSLDPWISLSNAGPMVVKVEVPGYLPLVRSVEMPDMDRPGGKETKLPAQIQAQFVFDPATRRRLIVRGGGKPVAGATVDLEWVEDVASDRRRPVAVFRTTAAGELKLKGGADRRTEVFVYAEGYEPERAIWNPGSRLEINLTPRNGVFTFAGGPAEGLVRIRRAASPGAVRTVRLGGGEKQLNVAAGEYDLTSYDYRGVVGYQRVRLGAGERKRIDMAIDMRPEVVIRHSNVGWRTSVLESAPVGSAVDGNAMLVVAGARALPEEAATLVRQSAEEAVYRVSRAGVFQIEASRGQGFPQIWREIKLNPGESVALEVPDQAATLNGVMSSYEVLAYSLHGTAGPRLQLINDKPTGWSVTVYLPKRGPDGSFTIEGIPPGDYHLYHHLIGEKVNSTGYNGRVQTRITPVAAWGGVPVQVVAGGLANVSDFAADALGDVTLRLRNSAGRPIEHATVRVRDRMSDSWRQTQEDPGLIEQSAHPIPYPEAVRVVAGRAVLHNIRTGWLEFAVEMDAGARYVYQMPVVQGQALQVTVPGAR
jgi:hypothetical protein